MQRVPLNALDVAGEENLAPLQPLGMAVQQHRGTQWDGPGGGMTTPHLRSPVMCVCPPPPWGYPPSPSPVTLTPGSRC